MVIGDNWTLIKNCMAKYDWIQQKVIVQETGITPETISRLLRTHVNSGQVQREYKEIPPKDTYLGARGRHRFYWRLIK